MIPATNMRYAHNLTTNIGIWQLYMESACCYYYRILLLSSSQRVNLRCECLVVQRLLNILKDNFFRAEIFAECAVAFQIIGLLDILIYFLSFTQNCFSDLVKMTSFWPCKCLGWSYWPWEVGWQMQYSLTYSPQVGQCVKKRTPGAQLPFIFNFTFTSWCPILPVCSGSRVILCFHSFLCTFTCYFILDLLTFTLFTSTFTFALWCPTLPAYCSSCVILCNQAQ